MKQLEITIKTEDCSYKFSRREGEDKFLVQIPNYYLEEKNLEQAKELFKLLKETFDKHTQ